MQRWLGGMVMVGLLLQGLSAGAAGSLTSPVNVRTSNTEIRGVWMWSSSVRDKGAKVVAEELAKHRINRVFFLVKGYSGNVCYPSKVVPGLNTKRDLLKETLEACHSKGIEVHAWYVFNSDNFWGERHPNDVMYHAGDPKAWNKGPYPKVEDAEKRLICPRSPEYRIHLKRLVQEVLQNYPVDGIHLDYIRYGHLCYCFCPRHQAYAASEGIDVSRVRDAVYKTFYAPQKETDLYFKLYRTGDKDIKAWVNMREEEINSAVKELRALVKSKKPSVVLSASFMPEGGESDDAYALCHYAQNYATAGTELDYILPMTYWETSPAIAQIALNAEKKSHRPVYSGLWAASGRVEPPVKENLGGSKDAATVSSPALKLRSDVQTLRKKGIRGFVLFQYGTMTEELWRELEER